MARQYPPVRAIFWAPPAAEERACYVVEFQESLAPGEASAFGAWVQECPGYHSVEEGPEPNQVKVFLTGLDEDCAGLNWLNLTFWPVIRGTVIVHLYVETTPLIACLRALGEVVFDSDDPARLAALPGIASAKVDGDQGLVEFDAEFAATADVAELSAVFTQQDDFAPTVIPRLGLPPAY